MDTASTTSIPPRQTLYCLHCNYNLRTLTIDALCPECGHPIAPSFSGDWLFFSDRRWLRKLYWASIVAFWIAWPSWLVAAIALFVQRAVAPSVTVGYGLLGMVVVGTLLNLGDLACVWLITTAEPRRRQRGWWLALRLSMRTLYIVFLVMMAASGIIYFRLKLAPASVTIAERFVNLWLYAAMTFAGAIGNLFFACYRVAFARRIPDRRLLRDSWIAGISLSFLCFLRSAVWVVYGIAAWLRTPAPEFYAALNYVNTGLLICYLLVALILISVTYRFARHFKRLAELE